MKFFSTASPTGKVTAREAVLSALSGEAGLFMPESLPVLDPALIESFSMMGLPDIAWHVTRPFFEDEVPDLKEAAYRAFSFPLPVTEQFDGSFMVELFRGPSLAFKDFGARFMAQIMGRFAQAESRPLTVVVATSGDTGGAVAAAFHNMRNARVVILYPRDRVTRLQEKQIAAIGGNVQALRIDGSFDDCQRLVKSMLADPAVTSKLQVTTANSINVCRLIPQAAYYFYAASRLKGPVVFSVPSGNFGNLTAGLFAYRMGLRVQHFIAATNRNRTVPDYLASGEYRARPSITTMSNAMDVGDPSNFRRMTALFDGDRAAMARLCSGVSITDEETSSAMKAMAAHGSVIDPHSAVAWEALRRYRAEHPDMQGSGLFLATAHPAKFKESVDRVTGGNLPLPVELAQLEDKPVTAVDLPAEAGAVRRFLLGQPG